LHAVVQVVFQRVNEGANLDLLGGFQLDEGIDEGVGEHAALGQEATVGIQCFQRFLQAAANLRDFLGLFRGQVIEVLVSRIAGVDRVRGAAQAGHQQGSEGQIGGG